MRDSLDDQVVALEREAVVLVEQSTSRWVTIER